MFKDSQSLLLVLFMCVIIYLVRSVVTNIFTDELSEVDQWLDDNDLGKLKILFKDYDISTLSSCGSPEELSRLPELPASEQRRLRRAAHQLRHRLVLRQWLLGHRLQHIASKLFSLDVCSLEDVYWLEDTAAATVLEAHDFRVWSAARQSLPIGRAELQTLKEDLWSGVVKSSRHPDAWTYGGMLIVSVTVAGLVTLAAVTQPALAPEAKTSLLQYVTGKYLHPGSCRVVWGWQEPQAVGGTLSFTVLCFQRNGHPYPVCDADPLHVTILHGTQTISAVIEFGSDAPALANTARVLFTVRSAGLYVISVTIGGIRLPDAPYRRWLTAARVSAAHCAVRRGGGAALALRGEPAVYHVVPKDEFDNVVLSVEPEEFSLELTPLGEPEAAGGRLAAAASYDRVNQRVCLAVRAPREGVFRARVAHAGDLISNGEFDCIVLTPTEYALVQRASSREFDAEWGGGEWGGGGGAGGAGGGGAGGGVGGGGGEGGGGRLRLRLSRRRVRLVRRVLGLFPRTAAEFRLCPNTKLTLQPGPVAFTLSDGAQALALVSAQRRLLAATFSQLLAAHCGGDDSFQSRQARVYALLRRLHARHPHERAALRVSRADLLASSLRATRSFTRAHWCRSLDVSFEGEQGVDWGGLRREWFSLICERLFDARHGLFVSSDAPGGLVRPNPDRPPHLKLKYYEFAGKIVGKCVYESALGGGSRQLVRARLARSFLAQLISRRPHYRHFEHDEPELYATKVRYVLSADLDAPDAPELYFSEESYAGGRLTHTHDLVPAGAKIRVTNSNKLQYLSALAAWRLGARWRRETRAFLRGLSLLFPDHLRAMFDENEMELFLCGSGSLQPEDWRRHTLAAGGGAGWARCLRWFWAAVAALTPAERARLLQFTTGSAQLPANGFQELTPRFQITAAPTFGALPTAHTCFNQLVLPQYDSYDQLLRALLCAITEGEGFAMI